MTQMSDGQHRDSADINFLSLQSLTPSAAAADSAVLPASQLNKSVPVSTADATFHLPGNE